MRLANWTSFGMIVTLLAWIAHKLVSSNKPTKYASDASCNAKTAEDWNLKSVLKSCAISLTKRWNGNFLMSNSVDFWYFRISLNATVPGRYLCGFLTPPVAGADLRAAFVASCFLGALPPVLVNKNKIYMMWVLLHLMWTLEWFEKRERRRRRRRRTTTKPKKKSSNRRKQL